MHIITQREPADVFTHGRTVSFTRRSLAGFAAMGCTAIALTASAAPPTEGWRDWAPEGFHVGAAFTDRIFSLTPNNAQQVGLDVMANESNITTVQTRPRTTQDDRNDFDFSRVNYQLNWSEQADQVVHAHVLVYPRDDSMPDWFVALTDDAEVISELRKHVQTVARHTFGRVDLHDVVNESFTGDDPDDGQTDTLPDGVFKTHRIYNAIGKQYIADCFIWAHQGDPTAGLVYNDNAHRGAADDPYGLGDNKWQSIYEYVTDTMLPQGAPIHGVGMQMHMGVDGTYKWDSIAANIRRFRDLGLRVYMTELDISCGAFADTSTDPADSLLQAQGTLYRRVFETALRENVTAVQTWGITDRYSWKHPRSTDGLYRFALPFWEDLTSAGDYFQKKVSASTSTEYAYEAIENTLKEYKGQQLATRGTFYGASGNWTENAKAHDGDVTTAANTTNGGNGWIEYRFDPATVKVLRLREDNAGSWHVGQWTVQYYSGGSWKNAFSNRNANSADWQEVAVDLPNVTRIRLTATPGVNQVEVQEFQVLGVPDRGKMPTHRWAFEGAITDSGTGVNGRVLDGSSFTFDLAGPTGARAGNADAAVGVGSLYLDGNDDYVWLNLRTSLDTTGVTTLGNGESQTIGHDTTHPLKDAFNNYTIALWFKADTLSGTQMLYEEGGGWHGIALRLNGNTLEGATADNQVLRTVSVGGLAADTWYHAVLTYDAGDANSGLKLYLNGSAVPVDTAATSGGIAAHSDPAAIGAVNGNAVFADATGDFHGWIDDVRVYDGRTLSGNEVEELRKQSSVATQIITPSVGTLSFSASNYPVTEGDSVVVSVDRTGGSDGPLSASVSLANGTAESSDWSTSSNPQTLSWGDGQSGSRSFTVNTAQDGDFADESIAMQFGSESATITIGDAQGNLGIQAEDYDRFSDTTSGNAGGEYRTDNVDIQSTSDTGGGYNVGWIAAGEWLEFDLTGLPAGTYNFSARVASPNDNRRMRVLVDGSPIGTINVPNDSTGWQDWKTVTLTNVTITGGSSHVLRLEMLDSSFNLNWVQFTK